MVPSPFPGMNPWLEQQGVWKDFHSRLIPALAAQLGGQVRPHFLVRVEQDLYVRELPGEDRRLFAGSDVHLTRPTPALPTPPQAGGVLTAPRRVCLAPAVEVQRLHHLVIEDTGYREVVTVIELLSPTNKYSGPDREQYLNKRRQLLQSRVHFVEVDLLRGGPRMPIPELPECDYCAAVSQVEERPLGGLWAWRLRDLLPLLPIPLRAPHPPATLDLKAVLDQVYDAAQYDLYLYQTPPHPQLSADEMAWARPFLPAQGG